MPSSSTQRRPVTLRRLGQVFTPQPVADWMARWVCAEQPRTLLDPAVGTGVFLAAVRGACGVTPPERIDAIDVDDNMLSQARQAASGLPVRFRRADFITADCPQRYEAIIANPPYVRHHQLRYDEVALSSIDRLSGRRLSRFTNLYGLFLVKIGSLLGPRGRAAVITPAEWLNADFGVALKAHLLETNLLEAVIHFDHAANVFEGALTTAAITLLWRRREADRPIRFCGVRDVAMLDGLASDDGRTFTPKQLDPRSKWTPLFPVEHSGDSAPPRGGAERRRGRRTLLVAGPSLPVAVPGRAASCCLGDIARCTRGIATGANDFFTLRESDRRAWNLESADLRFCITKAQHIVGDRLTGGDLRRLVECDQRVYLLCPREPLSPAVARYLEEGRRREIHRRYLPSHRPTWYQPEARPPAPILVSVFARGAFRFVLNEAGALNLTAYHGIYPRFRDADAVRRLFEYLAGPYAAAALTQHRRVYADGLLKVEPRDVEALPIPPELAEAQ